MNKLQVTDLKITKKQVAEIDFNFEEMEAFLNDALADYGNAVVTEETIQDAKKVCADLNKLAKKIDTFRKTTKKELEINIKPFEVKTKSLFTNIKDVRTKIDDQVKHFEELERQQKKIIVEGLIDATQHEIPLKEKYLEKIELKDTYLNSSVTANKVKEDLVLQFKNIKMIQDMEQMKIDAVTAILNVYNTKLRFKFEFEYFERFITEEKGLAELTTYVNEKVEARLEEEKAELVRIEEEKQAAIEQAKKDEAARVRKEEEAKQAELRRIEQVKQDAIDAQHKQELFEKNIEILRVKEEAEQTIAVVSESFEKEIENIVPIEEEPTEEKVSFKFEVTATADKIESLRNYLNQYGFEYEDLF